MGNDLAVEVQGLSFAYQAEDVLQDVSFSIRRGEFAAIVGPNGGGKTTLLKLILGLLTPMRGTIRVFGESPWDARARVGYMPQHARLDEQFPVNVLDVVLMGRLGSGPLFGGYRRADKTAASSALGEVGLSGMERRPFASLSGGQRQRVLIARALACDPELLLLDEPTANLDLRVQGDFYELLKHLTQRLTVVLVSHDTGMVSSLVRTLICVNRGVQVHAAGAISCEHLSQLYGHDVHMVHHHHG